MTHKDLEVEKLCGGLDEEDKSRLIDFFDELDKRIEIAPLQKREMIEDFHKLFEKYLDEGKSVNEIINLLDLNHLQDFYKAREGEWIMLDNAAIIYPLGMRHGRMPMFRLAATLKEEVDPRVLQVALYFTIKRFPTFASVVKRGFFWHYLETVNHAIKVEKEKDAPCKPISLLLRSSRSYRVLYYKNRISLEVFHVITDGSGAFIFLKSLLGEYFRLLGKNISKTNGVFDIDETPKDEERYNAFKMATGKSSMNSFLGASSLQLDGKIQLKNPTNIYHFEMDSNRLIGKAKSYGVTVTAYILALMFMASKEAMSNKSGDLNIQVPVNMRKYNYPKTLRNYSMYFSVSHRMDKEVNKEELIKDISEQMKTKGSEEEMTKMMGITNRLITSLRYVPLIIKQPVAQIVYGYLGNNIIGNVLSNLGVIEVPKEMEGFIESFEAMFLPEAPNKATSTLVTFNGKTRFTIVKNVIDDRYENKIYELFKEDGLEPKVYGSITYES